MDGPGGQDKEPHSLASDAGATNSKVVQIDPYQLKDAHSFCMVLYGQLSEGCPQGHSQHPKGRLLRAQGRWWGQSQDCQAHLDPLFCARWEHNSLEGESSCPQCVYGATEAWRGADAGPPQVSGRDSVSPGLGPFWRAEDQSRDDKLWLH